MKITGLVSGDGIVGLGVIEQFSDAHNYADCLEALGTFSLFILISTADT